MLYPIYSAIKTRLASLNLPQEWYNVQYEETMINESGIFVEFPEPLKFAGVSKDLRRAQVKIRLHIYSKALRTTDGISDLTVDAHEGIAEDVRDLLDGWKPGGIDCNRLEFTGWQHWHRYRGWMVTFVEFDAKKVL
jgi:hypothetical protein